jgi:hypothetical protein
MGQSPLSRYPCPSTLERVAGHLRLTTSGEANKLATASRSLPGFLRPASTWDTLPHCGIWTPWLTRSRARVNEAIRMKSGPHPAATVLTALEMTDDRWSRVARRKPFRADAVRARGSPQPYFPRTKSARDFRGRNVEVPPYRPASVLSQLGMHLSIAFPA